MYFSQTVESSGQGHDFDVFAGTGIQVYPFNQIEDGIVGLVSAFFDYGFNCALSHAFDGPETKTDVALLIYRKLIIGLVDVGSQHLDSHRTAFVHKFGDIAYVIYTATQYRSHVFRRIIGF